LRLEERWTKRESSILPENGLTSPHSLLLSTRKQGFALEELTKRIGHAFSFLTTWLNGVTLTIIIFFRIILTTVGSRWYLLQGILVLVRILLFSRATISLVISAFLKTS
jgi:Mg/Co/Ni transporter MgtE